MNALKRNTYGFPSLLDSLFIENRLDVPHHNASAPKVNIIKNEASFDIEIAAAGFDKEDFSISVENDTLTIKGSKTTQESTTEAAEITYIRKEHATKDFSRSFTLSKDIDTEAIEASYEAGILTLKLPVVEEKVSKKMIAIS